MMMTTAFDRAYFEQRIDRNRVLAAQSATASIRELHLDYIRLYEHLLAMQGEAELAS